MDPTIDFGPATARLADLVAAVTDDQLALPTPCPDYSVGDLLDHIDGLALAFTWAATKSAPTGADAPAASGDASRLGDDWRTRIPDRLAALADAWRDDAAWTGMTQAGPVEMPGQVAALVALDEVVVHGWDLARSTDRAFTPDAAAIDGAAAFVAMFTDDNRGDAFGPPVPTGPDASPLDRLVAGTGRDPAWHPGPPTTR
jgi:uncharacterized protein (TIGR03086 family)